MSVVDNRGIHEPPTTGIVKREPSKAATDIEECGAAFIKAMRELGHTVHACEFVVWKSPKALLHDPIIVISVPKVSPQ